MKSGSSFTRRQFISTAAAATAAVALPTGDFALGQSSAPTLDPEWANAGIVATRHSPYAKLKPVPVHAVTIPPGSWSKRRQTNVESSIPSMRVELIEHGRMDNFLDADDLWLPSKLEAHISFLEQHPEVDLTFSRSELIDEDGKATGRTSALVSGEVSFQDLVRENVVNNGSAVVMRRKALDLAGHFDTGLKACVDWDLWLRVALLRPRNTFCVDGVLTKYRMRCGQITKDWRRMEAEWSKMLTKVRNVAGAQVDMVANKAHAGFSRYLAYIAYENGDYRNSARLLRRALRFSALHLASDRRTWVLASALLARGILPHRIHGAFDAMARRLRSRQHSGVYAHR